MTAELFIILANVAVFGSLLVFLAIAVRRRDALSGDEIGKTADYSQVCGIRLDGTNITMPLVRVSVYPESVVVSYWRKLRIPISLLDRIEVRQHVFSSAVHLVHSRADLPEVIIWSGDPEPLRMSIETRMVMK